MSLPLSYKFLFSYKFLSPYAKEIFDRTYQKHQSHNNRKLNVIQILENKTYLKVVFDNGEFAYYYRDFTWG